MKNPQFNEFIRLGDVVQLQGTVAVAFRVNDSGAACYDLGLPSKIHHIAATVPRNLILQRGGESGLQDFLVRHKKLDKDKPTTTENHTDTMKARVRSASSSKTSSRPSRAKKTVAKAKPEESQAAAPSAPQPSEAEGKLFGHPVTIVARTVGKLGGSLDVLAKVVATHGIELRSPNTLARNYKFGQQGKYGVVTLTKEQLSEFGL